MGWGKSELKKTGENMKESRRVGEGVMRSTSQDSFGQIAYSGLVLIH